MNDKNKIQVTIGYQTCYFIVFRMVDVVGPAEGRGDAKGTISSKTRTGVEGTNAYSHVLDSVTHLDLDLARLQSQCTLIPLY